MSKNLVSMSIRVDGSVKAVIAEIAQKQTSSPSRITNHILKEFCQEYVKQQRYSDVA